MPEVIRKWPIKASLWLICDVLDSLFKFSLFLKIFASNCLVICKILFSLKTSNSSHYICPRVGYDVFYAMNCTLLISKYVYFFCLQAIELK